MKTKTFLLLCLLICMAATQLSAQNSINGNGTVSAVYEQLYDYWCPVFDSRTGGEVIDIIYGVLDVHLLSHFVGGEFVWARYQLHGEGCSENTGELFKISNIETYFACFEYTNYHFRLVGNQGSHYVGTGTFDFVTGVVTNLRFISTGKK